LVNEKTRRTISLIGCGAFGAYAPGLDEEEQEMMKAVLT
jgi:hypothetical protein